ncbi:hypothetical protein Bca101_057245 [Brassica carinata]
MAKMPSSSKLLAVMLFSFMALFIISQARTFSPGTFPYTSSYKHKGYSPVPTQCFRPPYCRP